MNEQSIELNHNQAECIKSAMGWGETVYKNICSGKSEVVVWGSMDYGFAVMLIVIGIGFCTLIIGFLLMFIRDL